MEDKTKRDQWQERWGCIVRTLCCCVLLGFGIANVALADGRSQLSEGKGSDRLNAVQDSLRNSLAKIKELEADIARIQLPIKEREDRIKQIKEKEKEMADLKRALNTLKSALKEQDKSNESDSLTVLQRKLAALEEQLAELQKAKKTAEAELARENAVSSSDTTKAGVGRIEWVNRRTINVVLIGKQVVPLDEPYFQFQWTTNRYGTHWEAYVSKATRVKDGEAVNEATAQGGCLAKQLARISTNTHYVKFWVCPDAVPTYRRLADAVKKQGFKLFWVPYDDKPISGGSGGGGKRPQM